MAQEVKVLLVDTNDEKFTYHLSNERDTDGNLIPQRQWVTGQDRTPMSVKVHMPIVVHGSDKPGSRSGYTLAIFNWFLPPVRLGNRFRKVTLEISFKAHGQRGGAQYQADRRRDVTGDKVFADSHWDPEIVKVVPSGTSWYEETHQHNDNEFNSQFDPEASFTGFEPYIPAGPSFSWKRATSVSVKLTGQSFLSGIIRSSPNAVRWTLLENENVRSGVPAFLRTAVLLRRRDRDTGQFLGHAKATYKISSTSDFKQNLPDLVGYKGDHPFIFDPTHPTRASPYDTQAASLASPEVAAKLEKEFRLVSVSTKGSAAKDDEDSNAALGTNMYLTSPESIA